MAGCVRTGNVFVEAMNDFSEERELKPSEIYNIFSKQSSEVVIL